jgi:hypothetical protein
MNFLKHRQHAAYKSASFIAQQLKTARISYRTPLHSASISAIIRKTENTVYLLGALLIRLIASPFVKIVWIWKCIGQLANISLAIRNAVLAYW